MSRIPERVKDIEVRYIFVRTFKFNNPEEAEQMNGHPRKGSIYRSIFNLHTKHHRLLLPDGIVMGFNQLSGDSGSAEFELQEININNILDFDIREEDLEVFLQSDNDLFEQQPTIIIEGMQNLQEAIKEHIEDEVDFSQRASEIVLGLFQVNPVKAEILIKIANFILNSDMQSHEDAAYNLKLSKNGMGLNIGAALIHLDRYASDNPRISLDENDLLEAIGAIVIEMERNY